MPRKQLINFLWMQCLWFAAVIGAVSELIWPALAVLSLFMTWQLSPTHRSTGDFALLLVAVLLGFILDSTWISLGWMQFASPAPIPRLAPLWILCLWMGLALTLNHSLAFLQNRLWLAGLSAAIASPLSYLGAERLGAVQITGNFYLWLFFIALSWAIAMPLLLWLAKALRGDHHLP
ncbi:MAG: DUF2878 domain-containing protein [Methyloprofundus sp.]|nr:DUF2878 domain-containing protein [Methyloprofundus sp.]